MPVILRIVREYNSNYAGNFLSLTKNREKHLAVSNKVSTFAPAIRRNADMAQLVEQRIRNA